MAKSDTSKQFDELIGRNRVQEQTLLTEIENLLRTAPPPDNIDRDSPDVVMWGGRVTAVIEMWNFVRSSGIKTLAERLLSYEADHRVIALRSITMQLHRALHDLRLKTGGTLSAAVEAGATFDYFDEIRRVIEQATTDLLFVDQYLNPDFVSRYLVQARGGVQIRLLTTDKYIKTLLPAVEMFVSQQNADVQIRRNEVHDRWIFVDHTACYQSGASFKDGAKRTPTTLVQLIDAFESVQATYEKRWDDGIVER